MSTLRPFSFLSCFLVVLALAPLSALESTATEPNAGDEIRLAQTEPTQTGLTDLTSGNATFAFELYRAIRAQDGNLFISPHSISSALAMTYAGARGETEAEMARVLHFDLGQEQTHGLFHALSQELARRAGEVDEEYQGQFALNVTNAVWVDQSLDVLPEYRETLVANYSADAPLVDFRGDTEGARTRINSWVSEQTEERIVDLIAPGLLSPDTRMVLTNTIYFNAAWRQGFDPETTEDGSFFLLDGSQVSVPMMRQVEHLRVYQGDTVTAVELPYVGAEVAMLLFAPVSGRFEHFESELSNETLTTIVSAMAYQRVSLSMPSFQFESTHCLGETLSAMGMTAAFSMNADFSGMTGNPDLGISEVVHKTFVSVDETGTEAAAATAVIMQTTSIDIDEPIPFPIDRPFLFVIQDRPTGEILFLGRVLDPS